MKGNFESFLIAKPFERCKSCARCQPTSRSFAILQRSVLPSCDLSQSQPLIKAVHISLCFTFFSVIKMSWPATSYPPPPRRASHSRSPPRGGMSAPRPPYLDPAYHPQDLYRAEWDAYERDRAWANYERERAA